MRIRIPKNFESVKDDTDKRRRRRRRNVDTQQIRDKDGHTHNIAHLTCGLGARCVKIRCWISQIEPNRTAVSFSFKKNNDDKDDGIRNEMKLI